MSDTTKEILGLLAILGCGLAVGRIRLRGISLGTSGVLFAALAAGHLGFEVPRITGTVGIILFVYCLGIGAGPTFLRMFLQQGHALAGMAVVMILSAGGAAILFAKLLGLSPDLASGLLAGALTSTPALAAATERLPADSQVAVGYGIAYPFGVVGVILFVQLVPRLFASKEKDLAENSVQEGSISRQLVEVLNPAVVGKRLRDVSALASANCQVSRVMVGEKLQPIPRDFELQLGQRVLVVGAPQQLAEVTDVLGQRCAEVSYVLDVERQRRQVVVTSQEMVGQTLAQLHLLSRFGITITRISRQDIQFVPPPRQRIQFGDSLTAIGESENLDRFVSFAGHRERTLNETDLVAMVAGLALGVWLGSEVSFHIAGNSLSLGMAGGPLLVGLIFGHFGQIGPFVSHLPQAARYLLGDIGLALFLAAAGSQAGGTFVAVVQEHGILLCLVAMALVLIPMIVGVVLARWALPLGTLETFGGLCGAMTSTPGLGALTAAFDSNRPAISYATVYPLALVLVTIAAPLLLMLLQ